MPLPVAASAALPYVTGQVSKIMDKPIIGYRSVKTKINKKSSKVTTRSFELNGWQLGAGLLGLGALFGATWALKMWRWKPYPYKARVYTGGFPTPYKYETRYIHLPAANPDGGVDSFGNEIMKALPAAGAIPDPLWWTFIGLGGLSNERQP